MNEQVVIWRWNHLNNTYEREPAVVSDKRMVATGLVIAGAHNLYWVGCSPDSPGAEWELTDAIAGGAAVVYDHFDSDKHSEQLLFNPPMRFVTGIYVEKFDHMHSLVFGYV